MSAMIEAPRELLEELLELHFPPNVDARLQDLMDRNNEGQLSDEEKEDLAMFVELSEKMSLLRARAFRLLGRTPSP
jgi:hypothetical protein